MYVEKNVLIVPRKERSYFFERETKGDKAGEKEGRKSYGKKPLAGE
jgi:hypothetical protein